MAPFTRWQPAASAGPEFEGAPRRPHAGLLRRERRDLLEVREGELRKLGSLMVEMYKRNDYRDRLLADVCAQVLGIDERLAEIDALLGDRRERATCECGSPLLPGAHFCPNCGRGLNGTAGRPDPGRSREG
ncbi:MAG: hypothetical protein JO186_10900 [Actinobacteria bacterium]|nr:hypothetical protein [Actinomycetota bacterium]